MNINMNIKQYLSGLMVVSMLAGSSLIPAQAYYGDYYHHHHYYGGNFFYDHPVFSKAVVGGGLGAVAGGLLSPEGNRTNGAIKGGLLGGALGTGVGVLTQPRYRW